MRTFLLSAGLALLAAAVLSAQPPHSASPPDGHGPVVVRRQGPMAPEKTEMAAPVAVPLTTEAHLLLVEARINGKGPFHLVIDSGAGGLLHLSAELAKSLALAPVGEALAGDPSGKNMERRPIVHVDTLEIGGARFGGIEALVNGPSDAGRDDGVIGLAMFAGLTATLDYRKPELRLSREPLPAGGPHVVPFSSERGIPEIDVEVAGAPMKVDVDTGSPARLSVPTAWAARLPLGEQRVVGRGRTVNNEFEIRGAELKGELRVAGYAESAPRIDIVDLFPVANLGSRFLRRYAVSFDMANRRMALER